MAEFDQRNARVTATGAVTNQRSRIHSITWTGIAGVGTITFTDGNGGSQICTFDTPAGAGGSGQFFIGEQSGFLFRTGIFCSVITAGIFLSVQYSA